MEENSEKSLELENNNQLLFQLSLILGAGDNYTLVVDDDEDPILFATELASVIRNKKEDMGLKFDDIIVVDYSDLKKDLEKTLRKRYERAKMEGLIDSKHHGMHYFISDFIFPEHDEWQERAFLASKNLNPNGHYLILVTLDEMPSSEDFYPIEDRFRKNSEGKPLHHLLVINRKILEEIKNHVRQARDNFSEAIRKMLNKKKADEYETMPPHGIGHESEPPGSKILRNLIDAKPFHRSSTSDEVTN